MPRINGKTSIDITVIGAGTLATALAMALHKAGYRIKEVVSRDNSQSLLRARRLANRAGAKATTASKARLNAKLVWICVPDDVMASVAHELANRGHWTRKIVVHSSGALGSEVLAPLKQAGATVASAHPLMTFASASVPKLSGVPFAIEGDPKALTVIGSVVRRMGGSPFRIAVSTKPAYHLFGFFSSPALIEVMAAAQQVGALAGFSNVRARELMEPIVRKTIDNCFSSTPQAAFSGPLRRGDASTIRKHLGVLRKRPELLAVYKALGRIALKELPISNRNELRKLFG